MKLNHKYSVDGYDVVMTRSRWNYAGGVEGTAVTIKATALAQEYKVMLNGSHVEHHGLLGAIDKHIDYSERCAESSFKTNQLKHTADIAVAQMIKHLLELLQESE
ncbi:hypothetical protein [Vibrio sp. B181a]|uniref:hypothetical protein n=1 Tax=Vibrio sp. B181a TaxID=2835906 RepID=UPI00255645E3|nr:hypothetical protein [Vibrio sp. B181a]MDK9774695.1 hypothetical protein [Vibrio sp. B181a]